MKKKKNANTRFRRSSSLAHFLFNHFFLFSNNRSFVRSFVTFALNLHLFIEICESTSILAVLINKKKRKHFEFISFSLSSPSSLIEIECFVHRFRFLSSFQVFSRESFNICFLFSFLLQAKRLHVFLNCYRKL